MLTWHCTTRVRHLPHTWYYRKERRWYRCDGQQLRPLNSDDAVSSVNERKNSQ
jgi:hypothetical protein